MVIFIFLGDLTPAQALDLLCTQNYLMIDIRSEKDKNKAGIPRLPSSAKNKIISVPYVLCSFLVPFLITETERSKKE